jgi:hypothetical protein
MTGIIEDDFLRFEGLDDQDIVDLNAALPELERVDDITLAEWAKLAPHIPALLRIFKKIIAKQRTLT